MSLYRRLFLNNHLLLAEMLSMRMAGLPYRDLVNKYHADKSTIKNWCHKFDVKPKTQTTIRIIYVPINPNPPAKQYKYQYIFDENDTKNSGKPYVRYIVESRKRYIKSLYGNPEWSQV